MAIWHDDFNRTQDPGFGGDWVYDPSAGTNVGVTQGSIVDKTDGSGAIQSSVTVSGGSSDIVRESLDMASLPGHYTWDHGWDFEVRGRVVRPVGQTSCAMNWQWWGSDGTATIFINSNPVFAETKVQGVHVGGEMVAGSYYLFKVRFDRPNNRGQFKWWLDGDPEPGSYTDFSTDLASDYGLTPTGYVTSNNLDVPFSTAGDGTSGVKFDWLEIEGYGLDPADGTCDPWVEDFPTDSGSDWPNWVEQSFSPDLESATRDSIEVASGIASQTFSWDAGAFIETSLMRDLLSISSFKTESRWRIVWKFKTTVPVLDDVIDIYFYAGSAYSYYAHLSLNNPTDDQPYWNLIANSPDDPGHALTRYNEELDPDSFYFVELFKHEDSSLEARLWKEGTDRPDEPADVAVGTSEPNDYNVGVDWEVDDSTAMVPGFGAFGLSYVQVVCGENLPAVTSNASNEYLVYINHEDVSDRFEWQSDTEEVLGGTGRGTIVIQDRDGTYEPEEHADVKIIINTGPRAGWVLFRGEIISPPVELFEHTSFRRWKIDCADYNNEIPQRLVGALDGKTWLDTAGLGIFVNIDPFATSLKTDRLTIRKLFDHYFRVDGEAIETNSYVGTYLTDFFPLTWNYSNLQRALESMAAYVAANLQFWIDPDLFFHWWAVPAWQDLAQQAAALAADPTTATLALMVGETVSSDISFAPFNISDLEGNPDGTIGARKLRINPDGSEMPEQIYVRGGTGYVYNAPPIVPADTKVVVAAPVPGSNGSYELRITENDTKLWHVDSTGYVSITYELAAIGGPWPVKFIHVPWNEERNKGGYFWKFLSGPHAGLLADDNTNRLNGYGGIEVTTIVGSPATPQIGTGGSGWVGEVDQDPNKRQAYLQAPISTTKAIRDSIGNQALYRGSSFTLRGEVTVSHQPNGQPADGWRAGQLIKITDARMPYGLSGKYFVIQRVRTRLLPATGLREYTLGFGDGPTSRYSYKASRLGDAGWPPGATQIDVHAYDLSPGPNSSQIITGQLVNGAGQPWAIAGKVVSWSLECYDEAGVLQPNEGTVTPTVSITDANGKARTTFMSGPNTGRVYFVFASVRAN